MDNKILKSVFYYVVYLLGQINFLTKFNKETVLPYSDLKYPNKNHPLEPFWHLV